MDPYRNGKNLHEKLKMRLFDYTKNLVVIIVQNYKYNNFNKEFVIKTVTEQSFDDYLTIISIGEDISIFLDITSLNNIEKIVDYIIWCSVIPSLNLDRLKLEQLVTSIRLKNSDYEQINKFNNINIITT